MVDDDGRSLTRGEFDAVIRRAAELASSDADTPEADLSEGELFRIAREVGLAEGHVRRALAEVRAGTPEPPAGGFVDRVFGPAQVRVSRVVPGEPERLARTIDDYLVSTQLLQRVRRSHSVLQYRPAADWASQVARATRSHKYYIASSKSLEVRLDAVDPHRTLVAFLLEPGTRGNDVGGAVFGGAVASGAAGTASAFGLALVAPVGLAIGVGVAVGASLWSGIFFGTGAAHRRKVDDVRSEVEGILDALETGTSLEPPPPAWRKWVKRHFHGVARDILGEEDDVTKGRES
ncbi:MAG: hypothetical protein AB7T31_13485 [Gemmatimonadales bacterium]